MTIRTDVLTITNLYKRFGALEVLRDISLTAHEGEIITIIGPSGAGKSTLLRCINFLEIADHGRIVINGTTVDIKPHRKGNLVSVNRRQIERLRIFIGMVFQNFNLWPHMTVLHNIIEAPVHVLGLSKSQAIERADFLLDKVGLSEKRDVYPAYLSGGQQQRVAIARALAMRPKILLFDEPTSALDPSLVEEVLQLISQLAKEGHTMIIVTHEMYFAQEIANEIIFLHQGQVKERGTPSQMLGNLCSEQMRSFLCHHRPKN